MDDMVNKNHLEWMVYKEDFNRKRIVKSNVFNYVGFLEGCKKAYRKYKQDDQVKDLEKEIRGLAMYYFWAKCEYEIMITSWPPSITKEEAKEIQLCVEENEARYKHLPRVFGVELAVSSKMDIYGQLLLNWDRFIDYVYDWGLAI